MNMHWKITAVVLVAFFAGVWLGCCRHWIRREGLTLSPATVVGTVTGYSPTGYTISYTFGGKPMTYAMSSASFATMVSQQDPLANMTWVIPKSGKAAIGMRTALTLSPTGTVVPNGVSVGGSSSGRTMTHASPGTLTFVSKTPSTLTYTISYAWFDRLTMTSTNKTQTVMVSFSQYMPYPYHLHGSAEDTGRTVTPSVTIFGDVLNVSF